VYSLPSTTKFTKTCKTKGNPTKDLILSGTGIVHEDIHCQYYAEDFILLPVVDSLSNITLMTGHVITPNLPQLISPIELQQLRENEPEPETTLSTLESERHAPDNHQR
jgi:hypothetical protein